MAEALNLDPTYLSQLENGRREVDDYYLNRAAEFEKEKEVKGGALREQALSYRIHSGTASAADVVKRSCLEYLREFLETCGDDPAKVGWTQVELREKFPLDKWQSSSKAKAFVQGAVEQVLGDVKGKNKKT